MADSDEEEMASLRSSTRYGGSGRTKAAPADQAAAAGDSDGESQRVPAHSSAARGGEGRRLGGLAPVAPGADDDDEQEDLVVAEAELGAMRGFLPVAFGKVTPSRAVGAEVHNVTRRGGKITIAVDKKSPVHFGHRRADAASAAGAAHRASRAEVAQPVPPPRPEEEGGAAGDDMGGSGAPAVPGRQGGSTAEDEADDAPIRGARGDVLPVSHEVVIPAHQKLVTALAFEAKGTRMITGSMDGCVNLFDFGGMTEEKEAFRSIEPVEGHMVRAVSYGITGGCILVICSDAHARIYDRDGNSKLIQSTVKGDMYVRDMQHTRGHTQMLTDGMWHPFQREHFITSSLDGTVRIWDLNATPIGMDQTLPSVHVLKTLDKRNVCVGGGSGRGGGLYPCCCAYAPTDAKKIVSGCSDGSLQFFFEKARYQKPDRILRTAHTAPVTAAEFIIEGGQSNHLVTRSLDNTMKVWDCRMLSDAKGPLKSFENLPCNHEKAGVCADPTGCYIVTGTPCKKSTFESAAVHIYDAKDFKHVHSLDFGKRSVVQLAWPRELNQLVVGTSTGEVVMLYSPISSRKGALHFVGKRAKPKASAENAHMGPVFNMTDRDDIKKFYSTGHGNMMKIRKQEARHTQKTLKPIPPPATDGNAGQSDTMAFAAAVLKAGAKQLNLRSTSGAEQDSQKALLAYADKPGDSTLFAAYKTTQPTNLLDWSVEVSEGDKRMSEKQKGDFCRKCGQKVCRCVDYSVWGQKKQRTG